MAPGATWPAGAPAAPLGLPGEGARGAFQAAVPGQPGGQLRPRVRPGDGQGGSCFWAQTLGNRINLQGCIAARAF